MFHFCPEFKNMKKVLAIADIHKSTRIISKLQDLLNAAGSDMQLQYVSEKDIIQYTQEYKHINTKVLQLIRECNSILKITSDSTNDSTHFLNKLLHMYVNVTWCKSYESYIDAKHKQVDIIIIKDNEEDMYAGIEHRQTDEVTQALKIVSRNACEKVIRFAFEYAKMHNRKKVTCFTKDNIMKQTDGLFHKVFDEIGKEYPNLVKEHMIIDIAAAKLSHTPEAFDVVVTPNFYGELTTSIVTNITHTQLITANANYGKNYAMFESYTSQDTLPHNKLDVLSIVQSLYLMLYYNNQLEVADKIQNAWLVYLENQMEINNITTNNIEQNRVSEEQIFEILLDNLNKKPQHLKPNIYRKVNTVEVTNKNIAKNKELKGVDVFVHWSGTDPNILADIVCKLNSNSVELSMITNRGIKVWPHGFKETFCTDHWRCRFKSNNNNAITKKDIHTILNKAIDLNIDFIKTENLYEIDGKMAYSLGQGQ